MGSAIFDALMALSGDEGARSILSAHSSQVAIVEAEGDLCFDVDTLYALKVAERMFQMQSHKA